MTLRVAVGGSLSRAAPVVLPSSQWHTHAEPGPV